MQIYDETIAFLNQPEPARFEELALRVFRHQFDSIPAYRVYCTSLGVDPGSVGRVDEVPPVSTLAFKYATLCDGAAERIFLSSGTSRGKVERSRHFVPRLDVYRTSAMAHFGTMVFPDRARMPILALHPTADLMRESSLSQMISWCIEEFGTDASLCVADRERVDLERASHFLENARRSSLPVCLLGTTAAFAAFFASLRTVDSALRLPPGSRLMDTGGPKGQPAPLSQDEIIASATQLLGIEPPFVINEYGMTEMCSQLYDVTPLNSPGAPLSSPRVKQTPPWLRARALDPAMLKPLPDGAPGLLSFFDLANVGSLSAIVTEDIGAIDNGAVRILGRAAGAEPRGCGLAIASSASSVTAG